MSDQLRKAKMCVDIAVETFDAAGKRWKDLDGPDDPRTSAPLDDEEHAEIHGAVLDAQRFLRAALADSGTPKVLQGIEEAARNEGRYPNDDELEVMPDDVVPERSARSTDVTGAPSEPPPSDAAPVLQNDVLNYLWGQATLGDKYAEGLANRMEVHPEDAPGGPCSLVELRERFDNLLSPVIRIGSCIAWRPATRPANCGDSRTVCGGPPQGGPEVTPDLWLLPVTWLGIGILLGLPFGIAVAVIVWRVSRGWAARWMDLREDPK